jgi:hypothetical protein
MRKITRWPRLNASPERAGHGEAHMHSTTCISVPSMHFGLWSQVFHVCMGIRKALKAVSQVLDVRARDHRRSSGGWIVFDSIFVKRPRGGSSIFVLILKGRKGLCWSVRVEYFCQSIWGSPWACCSIWSSLFVASLFVFIFSYVYLCVGSEVTVIVS